LDGPGGSEHLKRAIGFWGSFSMGYADIGANIYVALGLIALYASHAAPAAMGLAAISYIFTGLAYAELASLYPVAGGAQQYASRAFSPLLGFIAGWGLLLDYTICILLFSLISAGYLSYMGVVLGLGPLLGTSPYLSIGGIILILSLLVLNLLGITWSSRVNVGFVLLNLITLSTIVVVGLPLAMLSGGVERWILELSRFDIFANLDSFTYAVTLAMVSYIGIESISQAAEETKNPGAVIPGATKAVIVTVVIFALTLSFLSVTMVNPEGGFWQVNAHAPMVALVLQFPVIGGPLAVWVALMGATINYVSANSGVIGVSRVAFAMGRQRLLPRPFSRLHRRFRTPHISLLVFTTAALLIILANIGLTGVDLITLVASLYNFGALAAYTLVNLSLIALRNKDRALPRPWRAPLTIWVRGYEIPLTGVFGSATSLALWLLLIYTHGVVPRVMAAIWFGLGLIIYIAMRRGRG
jgi:APA family basic amino acid/polyamine antiporter